MHPSRLPPNELLAKCTVVRQRRSGPGGQHRNKVETGIVITHLDSGIRGEATERRSQKENHSVALQRLQVSLAVQVRTPVLADGPSERWKKRFGSGPLKINPVHIEFGSVLSECLDAMQHFDWDQKRAAEWFGCSPSQLVKLIKLEPRAFAMVNQMRLELGLSKLR